MNIGLYSDQRKELMGLAALLIIVCHMPAHGVAMPALVVKALQYGGLGVDIFLFLSGLGIYRSLTQHTTGGQHLGTWYARRLARVYIPWFLFAIPFYLIIDGANKHIADYLMTWSCAQFWVDGNGLWFVALLVPLYLLSPLLMKVCQCRRKWWYVGLLVGVSWLLGSASGLEGSIEHIRFGVCRMPCYFLGFAMAEDILNRKPYPARLYMGSLLLILALALAVRFALHIKLSLFWVQGMLLLIVCSYLLQVLKWAALHRCFDFMGSLSLESYFTNVCLLIQFKDIDHYASGIDVAWGGYWAYYIAGTLCCLALSWFIHRVSQYILRLIHL